MRIDPEEAALYGQEPGTFTDWEDLPATSDLLYYEGLHGAVVNDTVDVAQYPDLLIGVVPVVNLEWIQKLHRDKSMRGYSTEAVIDTILRRMPDYELDGPFVRFEDAGDVYAVRELPVRFTPGARETT